MVSFHGKKKLVDSLLMQSPNLIDPRISVPKLRKGSHSFGKTCIEYSNHSLRSVSTWVHYFAVSSFILIKSEPITTDIMKTF